LDFWISESPPVYFQEMSGCGDRLADPGWIGTGGAIGNREDGYEVRMCGMLARSMKLALQVLLGDMHVAQGHADVFVAQQPHQSGKADAETEHL